jgi:hypothetical protein
MAKKNHGSCSLLEIHTAATQRKRAHTATRMVSATHQSRERRGMSRLYDFQVEIHGIDYRRASRFADVFLQGHPELSSGGNDSILIDVEILLAGGASPEEFHAGVAQDAFDTFPDATKVTCRWYYKENRQWDDESSTTREQFKRGT